MKIMIASDLHGSFYYAERLMERFEKEKAEKLILLGDIYNHGPRNPLPKDYAPLKVAQILNANKSDIIVLIKGIFVCVIWQVKDLICSKVNIGVYT